MISHSAHEYTTPHFGVNSEVDYDKWEFLPTFPWELTDIGPLVQKAVITRPSGY